MLKSIKSRFHLLTRRQQRSYLAITGIQVLLSFLDLIGVALLGVLGAIAMRGLQSRPTGDSVNSIINILQLENFSFQNQVLILGVLSMFFLAGKSIFSLIQNRKIFKFLAECSGQISTKIASVFLNRDISFVTSGNSNEYHHILGSGVTTLTLGVLGLASSLVADVSLLVVVGLGIFILDPVIALTTFIFFGGIGAVLYLGLSNFSKGIGSNLYFYSVSSNRAISEAIQTFRELHVRNQTGYFSDRISALKGEYSNVLANQALLPNISKYIFEISLVVGGLLVCLVQFIIQDSSNAVASLIVFMAAGSRIAPALLRVQQNLLQVHANIANSQTTVDFLTNLPIADKDAFREVSLIQNTDGKILVSEVSYDYPNRSESSLDRVTLEIPQGATLALVGKSGSGKTTLVDVILGLLTPKSGYVAIAGLPPRTFIERNPGAIGYVPQKVGFVDGTIRENLTLTDEIVADEKLTKCLLDASLEEFSKPGPNGLDYHVGENGSKLSGGQRQRLGIARALFTNPQILVLDEATSALDATTERTISSTIENLKGGTTLIIIAHRLSTVLSADIVAYLDEGKLISVGSFDDVRAAVPNFDSQAKLFGL